MLPSVSKTDLSVSATWPFEATEEEISALPLRNHYDNGFWYDAEYVHIGGDVGPWVEWAQALGGSILDVACGTGRLSVPIAKAGLEVVGLDLSQPMLEAAEAKRLAHRLQSRLRFVHGDMRRFDLGQRFRGILVGLNGLMHCLSDQELLETLRCLRAHLHCTSDDAAGRLALDVFHGGAEWTCVRPSDPQQLIDPDGHRWWVCERRWLDEASGLMTLQFLYRRQQATAFECRSEVTVRFLRPEVLDAVLHQAGFRIFASFGDVARTRPFAGNESRRVVLATPR
ncbi:MAG: class I SAM-dependent methyltransferase [Myxococcota bacterium]